MSRPYIKKRGFRILTFKALFRKMSYQDLVSEALPELKSLLNEIDAKSQNERTYLERNLEADLIRLAELPPLERELKKHENRM